MKPLFNALKYLFLLLVGSTIVGSLVVAIFVLMFSRGLPDIITIDDYKPATITRILGKNDVVVGEYFEERRYVVPMDQIPDMVLSAFVSAEDDRFFDHQGIDLQGILRAAIVNFKAGRVVQGGSTITQQVAKSLLLTPERSFVRKIKEVILSTRMEKNLTKKQILYLYLNQIYLGQGAYGIEAAARVYFNKAAKDLSVAEAAILAGLPQAPSKYSPLSNPKKAKERQLYVLRRMHEDGVITEAQLEAATKQNVRLYYTKDINKVYAPYYVEHVRRHLLDKYGKDALYMGGLTVKTPIDADLSIAATKSVQSGLRDTDKSQGYRGPIRKNKTAKEQQDAIAESLEYNLSQKYPFTVLLPDGTHTTEPKDRLEPGKIELDAYDEGELYKAVVVGLDDAKKEAHIKAGNIKGIIPIENMRWAQPVKTPSMTGVEQISRPSVALDKGDLIWVKLEAKVGKTGVPTFSLEQIPEVQGALLSMDTLTGEVHAMVGGYSYELSEFNRTTQALRQPGSAYKPIIYSAAVDKGYTATTIIQDSPIVYDAGDNTKWKPENFEEKFYGDTTFRQSLIKSRNIPTIKIVQDIGIGYLINYTKRLGMLGELNRDMSISLGTSTINLLDMVRLYAVYPRGGRLVKPIFIYKVTDRAGKVLEETVPTPKAPPVNIDLPKAQKPVRVCGELEIELKNDPEAAAKREEFIADPTDPDRVLDPRTAYIMTHIMNEVTTMGTGAKAKALGRPAAGKTGTTNDYIDAWFMGFTPQIVTGVWAGFDTQRTIAPKATGAQVALPIWLNYMKEAVKSSEPTEFAVPKGITLVSVDGKTGKKVPPKSPGAVVEAYVEGTEPGGAAWSTASTSTNPANPTDNTQQDAESDSNTEEFLKDDIR